MKGISPLVAAILLIAFTVAIAGILATWATQFTQKKLAVEIGPSTECIGALDVSSADFIGDTISARVRNLGRNINLTNFVITLEYNSEPRFIIYPKKTPYPVDSLIPLSLSSGDVDFISIPTGDPRKPNFMKISVDPCSANEAVVSIP